MPERNASLIVIGGGIIGASVAYNLAKNHSFRDIVVLEKSRIGSGSTSASLGGFRHQFSNQLGVKLSIESTRILENFQNLTGYDPLVKRDGYLFIASNPGSLSQLQQNQKLAQGLGIAVEYLEPGEMERRFSFYSFEGILGGTYSPRDGHASTSAVLQGYVSEAKKLGVKFLENTEVCKILRDKSGLNGILARNGTRIDSKIILVAAGAYSGLIGELASVTIPIKPYPRRVLVTHSFTDGIPLEIPIIVDIDSTLAIGREGKGVILADNLPVNPSFELTFPEGYDERVISRAVSRVPSLSKATISYADAGLYEMTPDSQPIISAVEEVQGLYCCAGFAGHGFMHAPAVGELMADLIAGEKPRIDISSYDLRRFANSEESTDCSEEQLII